MTNNSPNNTAIIGYVIATSGVALVTALLSPFNHAINSTTVALALLLMVLFTALGWGSRPALVASALGVLSFNFFFLPPFYTLTIADPQNWVALAAFLITAVTVGQLSSRAKRRAEEAEEGKREIERLYREIQSAFERASEAEALRRSEQLKSALLDAVTHDLRTPLTSIKASVTTMLGELNSQRTVVLDEEGHRELLEVIDEETDRLNRFVESMVKMARLEAGELNLRRRWGSVDEIIETALTRADSVTRHHCIEIDIERELPAVRVDAQALAEVIYSLVENAAKYSPQNSRISITAARAQNDQDELITIAIEDGGPGIPIELRERIFDKFFRVSSSGQSQVGGLGMGLAIARGIVEAHGGSIKVEDGVNNSGARFVMLIPIGDDEIHRVEDRVES